LRLIFQFRDGVAEIVIDQRHLIVRTMDRRIYGRPRFTHLPGFFLGGLEVFLNLCNFLSDLDDHLPEQYNRTNAERSGHRGGDTWKLTDEAADMSRNSNADGLAEDREGVIGFIDLALHFGHRGLALAIYLVEPGGNCARVNRKFCFKKSYKSVPHGYLGADDWENKVGDSRSRPG
jgi:hypothetical protein